MAEIKRSIENIEKSIAEMEEMGRLYSPLVRVLLPERKRRLFAGIPLAEMSIELSAKIWPNQFKAGVDRCVGFNIKWTDTA